MIETTSPTLRNTKMDDNTFLSTTKSLRKLFTY
jgi:hypothetical protein